jgi:hypothetical protein
MERLKRHPIAATIALLTLALIAWFLLQTIGTRGSTGG